MHWSYHSFVVANNHYAIFDHVITVPHYYVLFIHWVWWLLFTADYPCGFHVRCGDEIQIFLLGRKLSEKNKSSEIMSLFLPQSVCSTESWSNEAFKLFSCDSFWVLHDDVIRWKHLMRYWPFVRVIHRSPANSPHKGQWRRALMFSLICGCINGWVNNGEVGDLRRHRTHYDVIVMYH